jgi:hypothetical protein
MNDRTEFRQLGHRDVAKEAMPDNTPVLRRRTKRLLATERPERRELPGSFRF